MKSSLLAAMVAVAASRGGGPVAVMPPAAPVSDTLKVSASSLPASLNTGRRISAAALTPAAMVIVPVGNAASGALLSALPKSSGDAGDAAPGSTDQVTTVSCVVCPRAVTVKTASPPSAIAAAGPAMMTPSAAMAATRSELAAGATAPALSTPVSSTWKVSRPSGRLSSSRIGSSIAADGLAPAGMTTAPDGNSPPAKSAADAGSGPKPETM